MMYKLLKKILPYITYWSGLDYLFYYLNRKRKRIITFHHVFPDSIYKKIKPDCIACSGSQFRIIIKRLKKTFGAFSLDLKDPSSVTLSFDDGYLSQYEIAAQILKEEGNIQAYIFISGELIPQQDGRSVTNGLIVDQLTAWAAYVPEGKYEFKYKDSIIKLDIQKGVRGQIWQNYIRPLYLDDRESYGENLLGILSEQCYSIQKILSSLPLDYSRLRFHGMTSAMLRDLASRGWGIGGHGFRHYPFGYMKENDCREDIFLGCKVINPYRSTMLYSYPFGGLDTIGVYAPKILKSIGIPFAVANEISPKWTHGDYFIPRFSLSDNKYRFDFELSGAKFFFKYFKLLPMC